LYFEATYHRLFAIIFKLVLRELVRKVSFIITVASTENPDDKISNIEEKKTNIRRNGEKGEESGGIGE
jgi:hypothetical protein